MSHDTSYYLIEMVTKTGLTVCHEYSNVLNYNAAILSAEDKFIWILSNEDPSCVRELAKFIHSCFQMAP